MPCNLGIVGSGNISRTHCRAAAEVEGLQIAAIYDPTEGRAAALAGEYGATAYQDWDLFLGHRPMDLVAIGSPSGLHADQGIAAARCGLHVLTEKPMDISVTKARALVEACAAQGRQLGVLFQDRVKPDILRLRNWLGQGNLGKLSSVSAQIRWYRPPEYYADSAWRGTWALDGGGALINQGIHTVDLLLWLFGPVRRVYAHTGTFLQTIEVEDTAIALLEFESGLLACLEATTAAYPGYPRRLTVSGSEGTLILEHDRLTAIDLRHPPQEGVVESQGDSNRSASSALVADTYGHRLLLENFLRAMRGEVEVCCSGEEGLQSVALVQAIYASARRKVALCPADILSGLS